MTSSVRKFTVFIHLPGESEAVPAGVLELTEESRALLRSTFRYGDRYVQRTKRLEIDPFTLSLSAFKADMVREPPVTEQGRLVEFGAFRDAAPDLWGRKLIENKLRRAGPLKESDYLEHAGSNRIGALDCRQSPSSPPNPGVLPGLLDLGYLKEAADRVEAGEPIPGRLAKIFDAGPSMGGARPKAVLEVAGRQWLAKFAARQDAFSVPQVEFATLQMAKAAGLNVPDTRLEDVGEARPALLVARFDREPVVGGYARRHFLSALTLLRRHESESSYASYAEIAQAIASHGAASHIRQDQRELFARMIFNILVSNNDDHLRNHGFVWDAEAEGWRLSPLYDVVPAPSLASERYLHLAVGREGRLATLTNAMSQYGVFGLNRPAAAHIIDRVYRVVREWRVHFEQAGVPGTEIDSVSSAFRHGSAIGLREVERYLA